MRQPDIFMADTIRYWSEEKQLPNGTWVPARPVPNYGIFNWKWRWILAWYVLTGKYDALNWEE